MSGGGGCGEQGRLSVMTILQNLKAKAGLQTRLLQLTFQKEDVLVEGREAGLLRVVGLRSILRLLDLNGDGLGQRHRSASDQLLRLLQLLIEGFDARRQSVHLSVHALQLRAHDVVQLVLDNVELHRGVRAEHGGAEGEARIVGASILTVAPCFAFVLLSHQFFRRKGTAAQPRPLRRLRLRILVIFICRVGDVLSLRGGCCKRAGRVLGTILLLLSLLWVGMGLLVVSWVVNRSGGGHPVRGFGWFDHELPEIKRKAAVKK